MTTLRNKIGQMLIIGFSGCEINDQSPIVKWLREDGLGGVLLFDFDLPANCYGKNLKNPEQIKSLTRQLNQVANTRLPLYIAIDYEGGAVDRLTRIEGCMATMKACEQANLSDEALYSEAEQMAVTIKNLGFNLNFAPVVDINLMEKEGIIGKLGRSYSSNAKGVIRAARQVTKAFNQNGITAAYKHFPGHGSAIGDTHEGFVDVTDSFQMVELEPYASLLADKRAAMVMTAHVINRQLDPSGLPATLSNTILTGLLRQKIGFEGVIVSDDLQMQAISNHFSIEEALSLTINAGADMLIFANQLASISATEVIDHIESLVKSGTISTARIEQAYQRIVQLKQFQFANEVAVID